MIASLNQSESDIVWNFSREAVRGATPELQGRAYAHACHPELRTLSERKPSPKVTNYTRAFIASSIERYLGMTPRKSVPLTGQLDATPISAHNWKNPPDTGALNAHRPSPPGDAGGEGNPPPPATASVPSGAPADPKLMKGGPREYS